MNLNKTVFAAAALLFCLASTASRAAPQGHQFKLQLAGTNLCMDAAGDHKKDGDKVQVYNCHGKENQRWTVTSAASGGAAIVGTGGFCLDVRGTKSTADGTPAQLWACHFGGNQRFSWAGDQIKEVASSKCLTAADKKNAAAVVLAACAETPNQKWHAVK